MPTKKPSSAATIQKVRRAGEIAQAQAFRKELLARIGFVHGDERLGLVFADEYISVHRDPVKFPSGRFGTYLRVDENGLPDRTVGVVVVPRLGDSLLIQEIYRYPTASWEWEFPRGTAEPGQSLQKTARQEVKEETNLEVAKIRKLGVVKGNTGLLSGKTVVFLADLKPGAKAKPQADEAISRFLFLSPAKLLGMAAAGKIHDSFTLSALLLAITKGDVKG